ncbi:hypothetical protein C8A03DRAFT_41144 [Achaetomium macrosporum]|uniref:Uncharacterized protein n=1 Tax=Achaetomium macrosporum TaxID=79813 RepID=A0AAN7HFC6_9PEZI|nr:hypothetical protein C8A03DRAFT_41144 [Achaetomium macrosporum]
MNWTEGTLYRHNRGRLRRVNPARQRQKEYFARARARIAEQKAAIENGPPPISRRKAEPDRKRSKATAATDDTPLPTISRFLQECSGAAEAAHPPAHSPRKPPATGPEIRSPSAGSQGTRKRRSHILNDEHQALKRRKQHAFTLNRHDVTIQIGSQEKRLGETSSVGPAISPVPSSQKIDNVKWHKWLREPTSPVSSDVAVEGSRISVENRVSPGVSEIRRPRQAPLRSSPPMGGLTPGELDRTIPGDSRDPNKLLSSSDSSQILSRYEEFIARLRRLEQPDTPVHSDPASEHAVETNTNVDRFSNDPGLREEDTAFSAIHDVHKKADSPVEADDHEQDALVADSVENADLDTTSPNYSSPQELLPARQEPAVSEKSDPDEAWKSFVFGNEGSEEVGRVAFEEAKHEAIRSLQPTISPAFPDDRSDFDGSSNVATVGTLIAPHDDEASVPVETSPTAEAFSSLEAAYDPSLAGTESEPAVEISTSSAHAPSAEVNAGTSSASVMDNTLGSSDVAGPESVQSTESVISEPRAGPPSVTTSLAVAPARSQVASSETGTPGEHFRFVQPKPFVGSRSKASQPNRAPGPGIGITLSKRKRGRPKKRANDGRTDIRALPNYNSDPIEEFEDEERPAKSLFPALELA